MWPGIPDSYQKLPESDSSSFRYTRSRDYQTPTRHALLGYRKRTFWLTDKPRLFFVLFQMYEALKLWVCFALFCFSCKSHFILLTYNILVSFHGICNLVTQHYYNYDHEYEYNAVVKYSKNRLTQVVDTHSNLSLFK